MTTNKTIDPKIAEILSAFEVNDGVYKRQAVEAAVATRKEITPYLINILEEVVVRPLDYLNSDRMAHIYAFILLGYFKEHQAHRVIVDLFSLPEAVIDPLFGDLITEDLSTVLYRTCNGSFELIRGLVVNKAAYEYCRSAAADALTFGVAMGQLDREEILAFFASLFAGSKTEPDSDFLSSLAVSVYDLYPKELMGVIKQAYDDKLISPFMIGYREFEEAVAEGSPEKALAKVRQDIQRRNLDDIHNYMSWWAMFDSDEGAPPAPVRRVTLPPHQVTLPSRPAQGKQKAQKKKKRKLAQASKKKNRRR